MSNNTIESIQMSKFDQALSFVKPILLLGSLALISIGWIDKFLPLAIGGAILYLLALIFGYVSLVLMSLKFRKSISPIHSIPNPILSLVSKVLEGIVYLAGLITFLLESSLFNIPGAIIWLGTIFVYVACGITASSITGIGMKLGYGGWYIPKSRRK